MSETDLFAVALYKFIESILGRKLRNTGDLDIKKFDYANEDFRKFFSDITAQQANQPAYTPSTIAKEYPWIKDVYETCGKIYMSTNKSECSVTNKTDDDFKDEIAKHVRSYLAESKPDTSQITSQIQATVEAYTAERKAVTETHTKHKDAWNGKQEEYVRIYESVGTQGVPAKEAACTCLFYKHECIDVIKAAIRANDHTDKTHVDTTPKSTDVDAIRSWIKDRLKGESTITALTEKAKKDQEQKQAMLKKISASAIYTVYTDRWKDAARTLLNITTEITEENLIHAAQAVLDDITSQIKRTANTRRDQFKAHNLARCAHYTQCVVNIGKFVEYTNETLLRDTQERENTDSITRDMCTRTGQLAAEQYDADYKSCIKCTNALRAYDNIYDIVVQPGISWTSPQNQQYVGDALCETGDAVNAAKTACRSLYDTLKATYINIGAPILEDNPNPTYQVVHTTMTEYTMKLTTSKATLQAQILALQQSHPSNAEMESKFNAIYKTKTEALMKNAASLGTTTTYSSVETEIEQFKTWHETYKTTANALQRVSKILSQTNELLDRKPVTTGLSEEDLIAFTQKVAESHIKTQKIETEYNEIRELNEHTSDTIKSKAEQLEKIHADTNALYTETNATIQTAAKNRDAAKTFLTESTTSTNITMCTKYRTAKHIADNTPGKFELPATVTNMTECAKKTNTWKHVTEFFDLHDDIAKRHDRWEAGKCKCSNEVKYTASMEYYRQSDAGPTWDAQATDETISEHINRCKAVIEGMKAHLDDINAEIAKLVIPAQSTIGKDWSQLPGPLKQTKKELEHCIKTATDEKSKRRTAIDGYGREQAVTQQQIDTLKAKAEEVGKIRKAEHVCTHDETLAGTIRTINNLQLTDGEKCEQLEDDLDKQTAELTRCQTDASNSNNIYTITLDERIRHTIKRPTVRFTATQLCTEPKETASKELHAAMKAIEAIKHRYGLDVDTSEQTISKLANYNEQIRTAITTKLTEYKTKHDTTTTHRPKRTDQWTSEYEAKVGSLTITYEDLIALAGTVTTEKYDTENAGFVQWYDTTYAPCARLYTTYIKNLAAYTEITESIPTLKAHHEHVTELLTGLSTFTAECTQFAATITRISDGTKTQLETQTGKLTEKTEHAKSTHKTLTKLANVEAKHAASAASFISKHESTEQRESICKLFMQEMSTARKIPHQFTEQTRKISLETCVRTTTTWKKLTCLREVYGTAWPRDDITEDCYCMKPEAYTTYVAAIATHNNDLHKLLIGDQYDEASTRDAIESIRTKYDDSLATYKRIRDNLVAQTSPAYISKWTADNTKFTTTPTQAEITAWTPEITFLSTQRAGILAEEAATDIPKIKRTVLQYGERAKSYKFANEIPDTTKAQTKHRTQHDDEYNIMISEYSTLILIETVLASATCKIIKQQHDERKATTGPADMLRTLTDTNTVCTERKRQWGMIEATVIKIHTLTGILPAATALPDKDTQCVCNTSTPDPAIMLQQWNDELFDGEQQRTTTETTAESLEQKQKESIKSECERLGELTIPVDESKKHTNSLTILRELRTQRKDAETKKMLDEIRLNLEARIAGIKTIRALIQTPAQTTKLKEAYAQLEVDWKRIEIRIGGAESGVYTDPNLTSHIQELERSYTKHKTDAAEADKRKTARAMQQAGLEAKYKASEKMCAHAKQRCETYKTHLKQYTDDDDDQGFSTTAAAYDEQINAGIACGRITKRIDTLYTEDHRRLYSIMMSSGNQPSQHALTNQQCVCEEGPRKIAWHNTKLIAQILRREIHEQEEPTHIHIDTLLSQCEVYISTVLRPHEPGIKETILMIETKFASAEKSYEALCVLYGKQHTQPDTAIANQHAVLKTQISLDKGVFDKQSQLIDRIDQFNTAVQSQTTTQRTKQGEYETLLQQFRTDTDLYRSFTGMSAYKSAHPENSQIDDAIGQLKTLVLDPTTRKEMRVFLISTNCMAAKAIGEDVRTHYSTNHTIEESASQQYEETRTKCTKCRDLKSSQLHTLVEIFQAMPWLKVQELTNISEECGNITPCPCRSPQIPETRIQETLIQMAERHETIIQTFKDRLEKITKANAVQAIGQSAQPIVLRITAAPAQRQIDSPDTQQEIITMDTTTSAISRLTAARFQYIDLINDTSMNYDKKTIDELQEYVHKRHAAKSITTTKEAVTQLQADIQATVKAKDKKYADCTDETKELHTRITSKLEQIAKFDGVANFNETDRIRSLISDAIHLSHTFITRITEIESTVKDAISKIKDFKQVITTTNLAKCTVTKEYETTITSTLDSLQQRPSDVYETWKTQTDPQWYGERERITMHARLCIQRRSTYESCFERINKLCGILRQTKLRQISQSTICGDVEQAYTLMETTLQMFERIQTEFDGSQTTHMEATDIQTNVTFHENERVTGILAAIEHIAQVLEQRCISKDADTTLNDSICEQYQNVKIKFTSAFATAKATLTAAQTYSGRNLREFADAVKKNRDEFQEAERSLHRISEMTGVIRESQKYKVLRDIYKLDAQVTQEIDTFLTNTSKSATYDSIMAYARKTTTDSIQTVLDTVYERTMYEWREACATVKSQITNITSQEQTNCECRTYAEALKRARAIEKTIIKAVPANEEFTAVKTYKQYDTDTLEDHVQMCIARRREYRKTASALLTIDEKQATSLQQQCTDSDTTTIDRTSERAAETLTRLTDTYKQLTKDDTAETEHDEAGPQTTTDTMEVQEDKEQIYDKLRRIANAVKPQLAAKIREVRSAETGISRAATKGYALQPEKQDREITDKLTIARCTADYVKEADEHIHQVKTNTIAMEKIQAVKSTMDDVTSAQTLLGRIRDPPQTVAQELTTLAKIVSIYDKIKEQTSAEAVTRSVDELTNIWIAAWSFTVITTYKGFQKGGRTVTEYTCEIAIEMINIFSTGSNQISAECFYMSQHRALLHNPEEINQKAKQKDDICKGIQESMNAFGQIQTDEETSIVNFFEMSQDQFSRIKRIQAKGDNCACRKQRAANEAYTLLEEKVTTAIKSLAALLGIGTIANINASTILPAIRVILEKRREKIEEMKKLVHEANNPYKLPSMDHDATNEIQTYGHANIDASQIKIIETATSTTFALCVEKLVDDIKKAKPRDETWQSIAAATKKWTENTTTPDVITDSKDIDEIEAAKAELSAVRSAPAFTTGPHRGIKRWREFRDSQIDPPTGSKYPKAWNQNLIYFCYKKISADPTTSSKLVSTVWTETTRPLRSRTDQPDLFGSQLTSVILQVIDSTKDTPTYKRTEEADESRRTKKGTQGGADTDGNSSAESRSQKESATGIDKKPTSTSEDGQSPLHQLVSCLHKNKSADRNLALRTYRLCLYVLGDTQYNEWAADMTPMDLIQTVHAAGLEHMQIERWLHYTRKIYEDDEPTKAGESAEINGLIDILIAEVSDIERLQITSTQTARDAIYKTYELAENAAKLQIKLASHKIAMTGDERAQKMDRLKTLETTIPRARENLSDAEAYFDLYNNITDNQRRLKTRWPGHGSEIDRIIARLKQTTPNPTEWHDHLQAARSTADALEQVDASYFSRSNEATTKETDQLQTKVAKLTEESAELAKQIEAIKTEKTQLATALKSETEKVTKEKANYTKLKAELATTNTELSALQLTQVAQSESSTTRSQQLQAMNVALQEQNSQLATQIHQLQAGLETTTATSRRTQEQTEAEQIAQQQQFEAEKGRLQAHYSQAIAETTAQFQMQLQAKEQQLATLNAHLHQISTETEMLRQQETAHDQTTTIVEHLRSEIEHQRTNLAQYEAYANTLHSKNEELAAEMARLRGEYTRLQSQTTSKSAANSAEVETLTQELDEAKTALHMNKVKFGLNRELSETVQQQKDEIAQLTHEREEQKRTIDRLTTENTTTREYNSNPQGTFATMEKAIAEKDAKLTRLLAIMQATMTEKQLEIETRAKIREDLPEWAKTLFTQDEWPATLAWFQTKFNESTVEGFEPGTSDIETAVAIAYRQTISDAKLSPFESLGLVLFSNDTNIKAIRTILQHYYITGPGNIGGDKIIVFIRQALQELLDRGSGNKITSFKDFPKLYESLKETP